jgi:hypothetical protein
MLSLTLVNALIHFNIPELELLRLISHGTIAGPPIPNSLSRPQECHALGVLLLLALPVHLRDLLAGELLVTTLFFEAAAIVRVCCRVDVEKRAHLAICSVGGVMAICRLLASLVPTSVSVELRVGVIVLVGRCCLSLCSGGGFLIFGIPCSPVVVSDVRSVLVVCAMNFGVEALPPVGGVFLIVWQGTALVFANELLCLHFCLSAEFDVEGDRAVSHFSLDVGCCSPEV